MRTTLMLDGGDAPRVLDGGAPQRGKDERVERLEGQEPPVRVLRHVSVRPDTGRVAAQRQREERFRWQR